MATGGEDRRRFGRVQLNPSPRGELGGIPVSVIEVSLIGARLAHLPRIPKSPSQRLRFVWDDQAIEYDCELVRSTMTRTFDGGAAMTRYESGVRLLQPLKGSATALRDLVSQYVLRAINEQIANARGLPPLDVQILQAVPSGRFRRCELVNGTWKKIETSSPEQPAVGFTVTADLERRLVDLLCRTYEVVDAAGRDLTKVLAQLSVTPEPTPGPLRRYVP